MFTPALYIIPWSLTTSVPSHICDVVLLLVTTSDPTCHLSFFLWRTLVIFLNQTIGNSRSYWSNLLFLKGKIKINIKRLFLFRQKKNSMQQFPDRKQVILKSTCTVIFHKRFYSLCGCTTILFRKNDNNPLFSCLL